MNVWPLTSTSPPTSDHTQNHLTESYVATPSSLPSTELSLSDYGHNVRIDHASGTLQFVGDPFAGSDDQQVSPLSHGIVVQPSVASLVRMRLGGIAAALNHALDILDPLPVPSAEEQLARVATLITAADVSNGTQPLPRTAFAKSLRESNTVRNDPRQRGAIPALLHNLAHTSARTHSEAKPSISRAHR